MRHRLSGARSRPARNTVYHDPARSCHTAIGSDSDGHKGPAGNHPLRARQRVSCRVTQDAMPCTGVSLRRRAGKGRKARRMRVDLVHLVSLVQPNKPNRPNKQERPAGPRGSRAMLCVAGGFFRIRILANRGRSPFGYPTMTGNTTVSVGEMASARLVFARFSHGGANLTTGHAAFS
jgi:hypothetical protein